MKLRFSLTIVTCLVLVMPAASRAAVGIGGVATQAEAEAGVNPWKVMTPLRTKQAIDALAPAGGGGGSESFTNIFLSAAHDHRFMVITNTSMGADEREWFWSFRTNMFSGGGSILALRKTTDDGFVSASAVEFIRPQSVGGWAWFTDAVTISGGITNIALTPDRALVADNNQRLTSSAVTATELGYLSGVTSGIQAQLAGKVAKAGDTMTGPLLLPNGLFNSPALAFASDTNTGIYRSAAGTLGVNTKGSAYYFFSSNSFQVLQPLQAWNSGTAATPSFSFAGDTDTGMYPAGANQIGFATAGANRLTLSAAAATKGNILAGNGTALLPVGVGSNDQVLTADSAQAVGVKWGQIGTASIADNAITLPKIQQFQTNSLLGNPTGGVGGPHFVNVGPGLIMEPFEVGADYASQAEAEAGANNVKLMTPLRTKQAIDALGGGGGSGVSSMFVTTNFSTAGPVGTTTETTITNIAGVGTLTIGAGSFVPPYTFRLTARGTWAAYQDDGGEEPTFEWPTLTIRVYLGGIVVMQGSGIITSADTSGDWELNAEVIAGQGSTEVHTRSVGRLMFSLFDESGDLPSTKFMAIANSGTPFVNPTVAQPINITAQWSVADGGGGNNSFTCRQLLIE